MKKLFLTGLLVASVSPQAQAQITINEFDPNTPGTDAAEFVEIYDGGSGNTALTGHALVFFNGSNGEEYASYDLGSLTTDANGFVVIGNVAEASLAFAQATNALQNGADAVAIYNGATAAAFLDGSQTVATATDLVDAIAYLGAGSDTAFATLQSNLGLTEAQDETSGTNVEIDSIQRNPDGASAFIVAAATPGATNDQDPFLMLELDPSSVGEGDGTEAILGTVLVTDPVVTDLTVSIAISDGTELSGPVSVTIADGETFVDFFLDALEDVDIDGVQAVEITVSATGYQDASVTAFVADNDLVLPEIVINEMQVKASGPDPQFVELYNNGGTPVDIAGWSVRAFESDNTQGTFGAEVGAFTIPSGSPINLAAGDFYLVGDAEFENLYGISPDLQAEPAFSGNDITMILFDESDNPVYTILSAAEDPSSQANNAGTPTVADISVSDGGFSPTGYFLDSDGDTFATIFPFGVAPSVEATPGQSNSDLIERLLVEIDNTQLAESAGTGAAIVTVTRLNDVNGPLTVTLVSSDVSEVTLQSSTLEFVDQEASKTVLLDVQDDSDQDGIQTVTITATAPDFAAGSDEVAVTDDDAAIASLFINEMIVDSAGTDTEFLEIYNADSVTVDLAGYSIEKWDSDSGGSFGGVDGGGPITIPTGEPVLLAPGEFYLMANSVFIAAYPEVSADLEIPNNSFENGSATIVLRDVNGNVLHTVFATDGGESDLANIDGTEVTPDAIGNDLAFALVGDGNNANVVSIDNSVPSSDASPGATNGEQTATYEVSVDDCSATGGTFVINFTASGSSDVYRSTDLMGWALAPNGAGVASGTYTDTAPPAGKAFYLIQEAGTPAP